MSCTATKAARKRSSVVLYAAYLICGHQYARLDGRERRRIREIDELANTVIAITAFGPEVFSGPIRCGVSGYLLTRRFPACTTYIAILRPRLVTGGP